MLQFKFLVTRTNSANGYVAVDDIEFKAWWEEDCSFFPPEAKPVTTIAPTTAQPTTTIEPTEPPQRK